MSIQKSALRFSLLALALNFIVAGQAHAFEWRHDEGHSRRERGGHWVHDRHEGRLGWWWVAGPVWEYFARPYPIENSRTVIIEQSQPQVTVVQPPQVQAQAQAPSPVLYYCKATGTYYPETMSCPGGWSTHVAGVPPAP